MDDGSTDGTERALRNTFGIGHPPEMSVRFERHPVNRGLGAALRTGFGAAHGEVIVTTDSDGTYRFSELPALLLYLAPNVDVVTAPPYHVDWHVHTYTCLFRAYRRRLIECVSFESDGFLAGTELLVKAMLMGYRVAEYPTVLHARISGVSKAKLMRTILAQLSFQTRVLLHRLSLMPLVKPRQASAVQG